MKNKLLLLLKARTFQIFLLLLPNLQQNTNNNDNSTYENLSTMKNQVTIECFPFIIYFILLGGKIHGQMVSQIYQCANSHEIKRRLLLGRKVMTNLDSIFKSRDITLPTKVHLVKAMVFPVVMYGCELDCEEG